MPFFLRKAISAGPFRFNLSKSGVGLSVGVKGLRFGLLGPRGNYIYAGRGGLYYRTSLNRAGQRVRQPPSQEGAGPPPILPSDQEPSVEMVEVESGDVLAMKDSRFGELLDEINAKQKQIGYASILGVGVGAVGLGVLALASQVGVFVLLLALPAWAIGRWLDSYKRRSILFYNLDEHAAKAYEAVTKAFDEMMSCTGKWRIESQGAIHDLATWKRNAGATGLVKRKSADLAYAAPKVIASNITPPSAKFGRQSVYFFPDAAFVIDGKQVGAISYDNFNIQSGVTRFVEEETVPGDAKVIDHTWKHPNKKDGGPDRRFSNNFQIPVCLYELAQFSSSSGFNEMLEFSRTGVVEPFANAIKNLALRMGGQATLKQPQSSASVTEQTQGPKPAAQMDLAQARQMLLDTKADFFRRLKESPNLGDELAGMREAIFSNFDFLVMGVLCTIASADGPINAKEAYVLNLLLGLPGNDRNSEKQIIEKQITAYNEFLDSLNKKATDVPKLFGSIIGVAIQLGAIEQGTNYVAQNDSVVKCFEVLGRAVSSADGDVNQSELASLSNFTAIAQAKAAESARQIQDAAASNSAPLASMSSTKQAPVIQKPTTQSHSGAIVSGDGEFLFEVVGESHYQSDLERIVGGRTKESAHHKCVAILTPEPDNPYDPQAVCVSVDGCKVAHLSRDWAAKFKDVLASSGYAQATCNAMIVGGWDRGENDRGSFGIKLDIALPFDLKPTAP